MMYCWARRRSACTPASVSASGVGTQLMVGLRLLRPARRRDRRSNSARAPPRRPRGLHHLRHRRPNPPQNSNKKYRQLALCRWATVRDRARRRHSAAARSVLCLLRSRWPTVGGALRVLSPSCSAGGLCAGRGAPGSRGPGRGWRVGEGGRWSLGWEMVSCDGGNGRRCRCV